MIEMFRTEINSNLMIFHTTKTTTKIDKHSIPGRKASNERIRSFIECNGLKAAILNRHTVCINHYEPVHDIKDPITYVEQNTYYMTYGYFPYKINRRVTVYLKNPLPNSAGKHNPHLVPRQAPFELTKVLEWATSNNIPFFVYDDATIYPYNIPYTEENIHHARSFHE